MYKKTFLIFSLLLLVGFAPFKAYSANEDISSATLIAGLNVSTHNLLIDLRGSRGGKGDVAAGYLITLRLLDLTYQGNITLLVDDNATQILQKIADLEKLQLNKIAVIKKENLQKNFYDAYWAFAQPSGRYLNEVEMRPFLTVSAPKVIQTVLGNTENRESVQPNALGVRDDNAKIQIPPAGLGNNEAGIYFDSVALAIKDLTSQQLEARLRSELPKIQQVEAREVINDILDQKLMRKVQLGLAYGITHADVQFQFHSYLRGLAQTSIPKLILTPSRISVDKIPLNMRSKVEIISLGEKIPKVPQLEKIYLIETQSFPHSVFVNFMALSAKNGIPPLGAGDGFLSAALSLGIPFALTQVSWNHKNALNFSALAAQAIQELRNEKSISARDAAISKQTFKNIFQNRNMTELLALNNSSKVFTLVSGKMRDLTLSVIHEQSRIQSLSNKLCNQVFKESL